MSSNKLCIVCFALEWGSWFKFSSTGAIEKVRYKRKDGTIAQSPLGQQWGYYTSFDNTKNPLGGQNSGAYIFRPNDPNEELTPINPVNVTHVNISGIVQEMHIEFDQPWIKQVYRFYGREPSFEVEFTVGPIPIDDGVGKEVVLRYLTDLETKGVFYTDSNGREFQKRTRSYRETWNLTEFEPVAGNFYPVNAAAYIEDDFASLAIAVDRTQGAASLIDGAVEFMVQRRLIADDHRGVSECLNETVGGMNPYPPYGDAARVGEGVVITGKHQLLFGDKMSGASGARSMMDGAFVDPLVFAASEQAGTRVPFRKTAFSRMKNSLPPNVMLITFAPMPSKPNTFLIRLGHQYAAGEDDELSKPVSVSLFKLVRGRDIKAVTEKTLSGNLDYNDWVKNRKVWDLEMEEAVEAVTERRLSIAPDGECMVDLNPMEIRTFEVELEEAPSHHEDWAYKL